MHKLESRQCLEVNLLESESAVRSREEDDVLQQSTKKVKESYLNEESSELPSSD